MFTVFVPLSSFLCYILTVNADPISERLKDKNWMRTDYGLLVPDYVFRSLQSSSSINPQNALPSTSLSTFPLPLVTPETTYSPNNIVNENTVKPRENQVRYLNWISDFILRRMNGGDHLPQLISVSFVEVSALFPLSFFYWCGEVTKPSKRRWVPFFMHELSVLEVSSTSEGQSSFSSMCWSFRVQRLWDIFGSND